MILNPLPGNILKLHTIRITLMLFVTGGEGCRSNGLPWSEELVDSVKYTNGSLYYSIK